MALGARITTAALLVAPTSSGTTRRAGGRTPAARAPSSRRRRTALRAFCFDRLVVVGRPDLHGRRRILQLYTRQVCLAPNVDLQVIAARTPGMVGAELAQVVNEATLLAARRNKQTVGMPELDEAVD